MFLKTILAEWVEEVYKHSRIRDKNIEVIFLRDKTVLDKSLIIGLEIVGKIEGRRRRGRQRMRSLDGITDMMDMSLNKLQTTTAIHQYANLINYGWMNIILWNSNH